MKNLSCWVKAEEEKTERMSLEESGKLNEQWLMEFLKRIPG
jgi:hypothetical protein